MFTCCANGGFEAPKVGTTYFTHALQIPGPQGGILGIMEKRMETTIVYWGYIGLMEKKMEATIVVIGIQALAEGVGFRA